MIHNISVKITNCLLKKDILVCEEKDIYEYGFELLISSALGFLIILTAGLIFNILLESMLFYFIFISVRPFCGGYHADSHLKCKLTFVLTYVIVMFFSRIFAANYMLIYNLLVLTVYILSIILYAPIEHPNKPIDKAEIARNRKISIILAFTLSAISIVVSAFSVKYSAIISLTLFSVAMLMIITKLKKEEVLSENNYN